MICVGLEWLYPFKLLGNMLVDVMRIVADGYVLAKEGDGGKMR